MARFSKNDIPKGLHELRAVAIEDAKFKFMVHLLQVKDVILRLLLHSAMLGLVVAVARTLLELLIVWHRTHLGRGQQSAAATCGDSTLAVCYSKLVNNVLQPGPATAAPSVDRKESAILASSVAREQACST